MKRNAVLFLLLLAGVGCGSPAKQSQGSGTGSSSPSMTGSWSGTINLQGYTPDLTLNLSEDSSGKITGDAVSDTGCSFSVPVSGSISGYTFSVQTDDGSLLFSGSLANNGVEASGSVTIGGNYNCGPASGAPFAVVK